MLFRAARAARAAGSTSAVAASAVSLTLAATLAHAQPAAPSAPASAAPVTTLPAVEVKARAERESATGPVDGYRARRSATATKTDTPLEEVPQSISVIGAEQVRDQSSQTMQEVLRYSAGVRAEMYGLDNRGDWFTLRGGSEGSVLQDGLRVPLSGYYGVVRNEPHAFERIEVLRGPASVIAGQNGPGGVVNLVSKRPQAEAMREVQVQIGNRDHQQVAFDLTGPLTADGSVLYRLVGLEKDSDTQVQHAYDRRTFVAPSLTWKPARGTSLTAYAEYQKDKSGNTNAFLPIEGTLKPAPNGPIPIDTFIGEPAWDRYGGTRERVGYAVEQQLGDNWQLRHHLRHDRLDGGMRTMYAAWYGGFVNAAGTADANGRYLDRVWFFTDDRARITNADLLLEGKLTLGRTRHTLLVGADHLSNRTEQSVWSGAATPLNVYEPVYGSFAEPDTATLPSTPATAQVRNLGLLVQDQIRFGETWVLTAGLRHDTARTEGVDRSDSAVSKNLGLVYRAGAFSPYASYSESFEPVAGSDFAGTAFKPKRGKQLEAGVKWVPDALGVSASAAVYRLEETNRLTGDPDHINFSVQRGVVDVKGVELEANARLRAWDLLASYTYMDARQGSAGSLVAADAVYVGKQLSGIPKHSASVWAVHRFGALGLPGLRVGAGVRYVGETSDGVDVTTTPSNTLLDLLLAYDTGPWRLALNINNATDKTYIATCLERGDCWFGTKRRAVASVAYRW